MTSVLPECSTKAVQSNPAAAPNQVMQRYVDAYRAANDADIVVTDCGRGWYRIGETRKNWRLRDIARLAGNLEFRAKQERQK